MEYTDSIRMDSSQALWEPLVRVLAARHAIVDEATGETIRPVWIELWRHWTTVRPPPEDTKFLDPVRLHYYPESSYMFYSSHT